jgi:hypothetical protein
MNLLTELIEDTLAMPGEFADVATQGPIEALLVAAGAVLVLGSSAVFGVLTLGALVDFLTPSSTGATHPEGR